MPSSRVLSSALSPRERKALLLVRLLKNVGGKKELSKLEKVLEEEVRRKWVKKGKEQGKEKRRKLEKQGKRETCKRERAPRKKDAKQERKPRRRVSEAWTAKDFAVEAVKRNLRPDGKWVQLRSLGKWWQTYTRLDLEELVKALAVLKEEHVLTCKTAGRQWKLGVRAGEVTLMEEASKKRAEGVRNRRKKAGERKEAVTAPEGREGGEAGVAVGEAPADAGQVQA